MAILFLNCSKNTDNNPKEFTLVVTSSPMDGGSVSPSNGTFEEGSQIQIRATPANGYSFVGWTGNIISSDNPLSLSMDSNKMIAAVFQKLDSDGDGVTDDIDQCNNTRSGVEIDANGCELPNIYLDENGVTIKCSQSSQVGDTAEINGTIYTIVDEGELRQMVSDGADITQVCTCKITDMSNLFENRGGFNQDISSWDVSKVTDMSYMFRNTAFNRPIGNWDVSSVRNMEAFLSNAPFDQDISLWDVRNVTNMNDMFRATPFNQPLDNWDVSSVSVMIGMFSISEFNQPIGNWNVGNVVDMRSMFSGAKFNQDIGSWDVTKVENMEGMFYSAPNFNQDLGGWDVGNVVNCTIFSYNNPQWTLPKPNFTNCTP